MKSLPPEFLYVAMFAVILLFQYFKKRMAQRAEGEAARNAPPPPPFEEPPVEKVPSTTWVVQAPPAIPITDSVRFGGGEAPRSSPARTLRRFSRRALMGNRRRVQDAVVIASILGPCRAFEPHELR